jgi:fluoride exporter
VERESAVLEGLESEQRVRSAHGRTDRRELAAIFLGGFVGAIARAALAKSLTASPGEWPWATFAVNLLGAAILGYVIARDQMRPVPSIYRVALLAIGFCGALTTFSTLMVELLKMIDASRWALGCGYAAASIAGGLIAVRLAGILARRGGGPE